MNLSLFLGSALQFAPGIFSVTLTLIPEPVFSSVLVVAAGGVVSSAKTGLKDIPTRESKRKNLIQVFMNRVLKNIYLNESVPRSRRNVYIQSKIRVASTVLITILFAFLIFSSSPAAVIK